MVYLTILANQRWPDRKRGEELGKSRAGFTSVSPVVSSCFGSSQPLISLFLHQFAFQPLNLMLKTPQVKRHTIFMTIYFSKTTLQ